MVIGKGFSLSKDSFTKELAYPSSVVFGAQI